MILCYKSGYNTIYKTPRIKSKDECTFWSSRHWMNIVLISLVKPIKIFDSRNLYRKDDIENRTCFY